MLATVPSRTSASRLKKSLAAVGIKTNITQTPSVLTKEGCGYSHAHGYGLSNIRRVVDKYSGDIDIALEDGEFCLTIMLMLA